MNIVRIDQNSPSFGWLRVPMHSSKVRGRQNINCSEEIIQYLDYLKGLGLVRNSLKIDERSAKKGFSVPIKFIMTKPGVRQAQIKAELEALGGQEIESVSEQVAKKTLERSKRLNILDGEYNTGAFKKDEYLAFVRSFLDLEI